MFSNCLVRGNVNKIRYFTVEEANASLPLVRRIVADILICGRILLNASDEQGAFLADEDPDHKHCKDAFSEYLSELDEIGCAYCDWQFRHGALAFPARIDGNELLLSWKIDEDAVDHYYYTDETFNDRRKISELSTERELPVL